MGPIILQLRIGLKDGRLHLQCPKCRTDKICLTTNEAKTEATRHHQWHQQKAGK